MADGKQIAELLNLDRQPVAIKFQPTAPEGVPRVDERAVSGCTYWKLAAEGQTFYTEASDHLGCPVGAHTHGVDMPAESATELEGLIGTMVQLEYLTMEEVPGIPQLKGEFGVAVYAPLAEASFEPDAVLISGNAKQIMLVAEAAHACGASCDTSMVGRPTCAAIPAVIESGQTSTNLGCIGNRVYTEVADDELYFVIAGPQITKIADKLHTIVNANQELAAFHQNRVTS